MDEKLCKALGFLTEGVCDLLRVDQSLSLEISGSSRAGEPVATLSLQQDGAFVRVRLTADQILQLGLREIERVGIVLARELHRHRAGEDPFPDQSFPWPIEFTAGSSGSSV